MPHFPSKPHDSSDEHVDAVARDRRIRIKNRRKRYLDLHPDYFKEPHLELAGRIISASGPIPNPQPIHLPEPLLYDRLVRRFQSAAEREREGRERGYSRVLEANLVRSEARLEALEHPDPNSPLIYSRARDGSIMAVEQNVEDRAQDRDDGWEKWVELVGLRFLRGDDVDFDYATVDDNDEYDDRDEEGRRTLETYLEGEEEEFVGQGRPTGQTGIQDF